MGLAGKVFTKDMTREIEVEGHKIVVKKLTARDSLLLDSSITAVSTNTEIDFKTMFTSFIDLLSVVIVSVDGDLSAGKEDAKEFLLGLEQAHVTEIFQKSKVFGDVTPAELKNSEGTQP